MYKSMFEMSIQEINGKGPKKRKKSPSPLRECSEEEERAPVAGAPEPCGELAAGAGGSDRRRVHLLHWQDMPPHLQFNPYVLTGYRPLQTVRECLDSLFYFHNETINIFTHGVSIVYILCILPGLLPWGDSGGVRFLSLCHFLGALAPWCGSFLYHLFMNHESGEIVYYRLLQLDMLGIWVSQSIGAIPMVTATVYCAPTPMRCAALAAYCLVRLVGLYESDPDGDRNGVLRADTAALCRSRRVLPRQPLRTLQGDARVVPVGAAAVLRVAFRHASSAGVRARCSPRRRRPARNTTRRPTGRCLGGGRRDRCAAHPGEVVPRRSGPLSQLTQHHARAGRARRLLHAPGDDPGPDVDVPRGVPRPTPPALTTAPAPRPPISQCFPPPPPLQVCC